MTPDQDARLAAVENRIAEALIQDADPENWPGNGPGVLKRSADLSREERGDRDWSVKIVMKMAALYKHVAEIRAGGGLWERGKQGEPPEDGAEDRFLLAEAEASKLLARARSRRKADAPK